MDVRLKQAIEIVNTLVFKAEQRHLSPVEILIIQGTWESLDYDKIAAQNQYATSYIRQDVAPKLWKRLSQALGEKVKKSNLSQVLDQLLIVTQERQAQQSTSFVDSRYIERPPVESICYSSLLKPSALVRVKAAKLMGKTLLMGRILQQLEETVEYRTILLSLRLADRQTHLNNLSRFLRWFCLNLTQELGLPDALDEYWNEEGIGAKVSCTTYLEQYLLTEVETPLVLVLDDVDLLFPHPEVYEDFFGLLRSWHEKSRLRRQWQRLRLVIIHSTDIYIRLNINQSPFNVGVPIELPEFSLEQAQHFAKQHQVTPNLVEELMALVGGHPYLLEQAFIHFQTHPDQNLQEFLKSAVTESGIYKSHLREYWAVLQQEPTFRDAINKMIETGKPVKVDPIMAYQLQGIGLIRLDGNFATPRCELYRQYFSSLLQASM